MSATTNGIDCTALDEQLLDYLYDELAERDREQIEEHVAGCGRCASEIAAFRRVRQAVRALPVEEPSPQVTTRLLEAAAGRNVVPLPLPIKAAQGSAQAAAASSPAAATPGADGAAGDAEPSAASTEFILAAARAQVAGAAAAEMAAPAAATVASSSLSLSSSSSSSYAGEAVPIAAAKRRRWLAHPAFAAAASFAVVGLGALWFLSVNRGAVLHPAPQMAMAPAATSPSERAVVAAPAIEPPRGGEPVAAAESERARLALDEMKQRSGLLAKEEHMARPSLTVEPLRPVPPAASGAEVLGWMGRGGRGGAGDGYAAGAVAHGRVGQSVGQPSPAPARPPSGRGVTLAADENEALERSIVAIGASGKKRDGVAEKSTSQREELALADAPKAPQNDRAWAQPPPAAAPTPAAPAPATAAAPSMNSRAARSPADSDDLAGAQLEQGVAVNNTRNRAQVKSSPLTAFKDAYRIGCSGAAEGSQLLESYRELKASDPAYALPTNVRMGVASCYRKMKQFEQARAEFEALRVAHPEQAQQIDKELANVNVAEQQIAQRRAAEAPQAAPATKAKQARPKAGKAASDAASY